MLGKLNPRRRYGKASRSSSARGRAPPKKQHTPDTHTLCIHAHSERANERERAFFFIFGQRPKSRGSPASKMSDDSGSASQRGWQPSRSLTPRSSSGPAGPNSARASAWALPFSAASASARGTSPAPELQRMGMTAATYARRAQASTPRETDRTWETAGSRGVLSAMLTPRERASPPRGKVYGSHDRFFADVVVPQPRELPKREAPQRDDLSRFQRSEPVLSIEHLVGPAREAAMRDSRLAPEHQNAQHQALASSRSASVTMPRGRTQTGSSWQQPGAMPEGHGMASARGQRMSPSYQARRTTWTRPTRNPYGYKAVVDLGELKVHEASRKSDGLCHSRASSQFSLWSLLHIYLSLLDARP